jgi:hypothetical protein
MSKIAYIAATTGLFGLFFASIYLTLVAYDHSGLPTKYEALAVTPAALVWAVLKTD